MSKGFSNINTNQNYDKLNDHTILSHGRGVWRSDRLWTVAIKNAESLALNLQHKGYYAQSYTMFDYYKTLLAYIKVVYYKYWLLYFAPIDTVSHVLKVALKNEKPIIDSFPKDSDRAEQLIFTSIIPFVKICTISNGPSIEKLVGHLLQVIDEIRSLLTLENLNQDIEKPTLKIIGRFIPNSLSKENIMGELLRELSCYFPESILKLAISNDNKIADMLNNPLYMSDYLAIYLVPYFEHFQKEGLKVIPELKMPPMPTALTPKHHDMLLVMSRKSSEMDRELASMIFTMNDSDQSYFDCDHYDMIFDVIPILLPYLSHKLKILYKPLDPVSRENVENREFFKENPNEGVEYINSNKGVEYLYGNSSADYLDMNWNYRESEAMSILSFMPFLKFCYYPMGPSVPDFIDHFVKQKTQVLAEKRQWSFDDFSDIFKNGFKEEFNRELDCYHKILNSQDWDFKEALIKKWTTSELEE